MTESATHQDMHRQVVWTNHPECVRGTWVEEIADPSMAETQRWFQVELDLGPLLDPPAPRHPVGRWGGRKGRGRGRLESPPTHRRATGPVPFTHPCAVGD